MSSLDPVVSAAFALKLPVNPTILRLLRLGDLTNIYTMTSRTDKGHSRNKPFNSIFLSLRLAFAEYQR